MENRMTVLGAVLGKISARGSRFRLQADRLEDQSTLFSSPASPLSWDLAVMEEPTGPALSPHPGHLGDPT